MIWTIQEHITFKIEADTAQDALDDWLNNGEQANGYAFQEVGERAVFHEDGTEAEVEEPA